MSSVALPRPAPIGAPLPAWRVAGPTLVVLLLALLAAYRDTAIGMATIWWRSETFMHAILVVPIVLWLVWRRRADLAEAAPSPSPAWLAGIALAAFGWLVGELGDANAVTQFALVAMVVMAVPAVLGRAVARRIMFPLGFLFFAVPIGEFALPWLMEWTANFTVFALHLSGIPIYREGQSFIIPSGAWSVVEACSGVRYLIASVMVGTLFAYLNYDRPARRWAFVGIAVLVPVVANWVRAYLIVMIGHLSGNRLAVGVDHIVYGWVFFGVVMTIMFTIGIRWQETAPPAQAVPAPVAAAPAPRAGAFVGTALAVLLVALLPHGVLGAIDARPAGPLPTWNAGALGPRWQPAAPVAAWTPAFMAPSARFESAWTAGGRVVDLQVAYYRDQGEGHKLVSSLNAVVSSTDRVWRQVGAGEREIDIDGTRLTVRSTRLAGAADLLVWQLYWTGDRLTSGDVQAKLYGVAQRLRGGGDDGAAIFVSTVDDGARSGDAVLAGFLRDNLGAVTARLRAARDAR